MTCSVDWRYLPQPLESDSTKIAAKVASTGKNLKEVAGRLDRLLASGAQFDKRKALLQAESMWEWNKLMGD